MSIGAAVTARVRKRVRARRAAHLALLLCALWPSAALPADAAEASLKQAISLYDLGRFEESLAALARAERATQDPRLLGRVHLHRGVNLAILGREGAARQAFVTALERDGSLELDPERFKASIVDLFRAAQGRGKARLSVRSTPAGAEVLVDGTSIGRTPLQRAQVWAGEHQLVLRLEGAAPQSRRLTLAGGQEQTVEATFQGGPAGHPSEPAPQPGARPFVASFALGGAIGLAGGIGQFKLSQDFGYHFSRSASGLAIGLALSEAFSSHAADKAGNNVAVTFVQVGPRLWWDLCVWKVGLYLAPVLQLGLAYARGARLDWSASAVGLAVHGGLELKLLLGEHVLIFLRPLGVDLMTGSADLGLIASEGLSSGSVVLRYDLMLGAGIVF